MTDMVAARARLLNIVVEAIQQEHPGWNPADASMISDAIMQQLTEEDAKKLSLLSDEHVVKLCRELMPENLPGLYGR